MVYRKRFIIVITSLITIILFTSFILDSSRNSEIELNKIEDLPSTSASLEGAENILITEIDRERKH